MTERGRFGLAPRARFPDEGLGVSSLATRRKLTAAHENSTKENGMAGRIGSPG